MVVGLPMTIRFRSRISARRVLTSSLIGFGFNEETFVGASYPLLCGLRPSPLSPLPRPPYRGGSRGSEWAILRKVWRLQGYDWKDWKRRYVAECYDVLRLRPKALTQKSGPSPQTRQRMKCRLPTVRMAHSCSIALMVSLPWAKTIAGWVRGIETGILDR